MNGPPIEIVEATPFPMNGLALVDQKGAVWLTFARPWWDISFWFWFWLAPGERAWVLLKRPGGVRIRIRAVCVAAKHIRVGTPAA